MRLLGDLDAPLGIQGQIGLNSSPGNSSTFYSPGLMRKKTASNEGVDIAYKSDKEFVRNQAFPTSSEIQS